MKITFNQKAFFALWLGCIVGSLAVLPYSLSITGNSLSFTQLLLYILVSMAINGLVVWLGLNLLDKTDFTLIRKSKTVLNTITIGVIGARSFVCKSNGQNNIFSRPSN